MTTPVDAPVLSHTQIAGCFNRGVGRRHRVRLIGGADEPLYLPAPGGWSTIRYTRDYAASALHELAHWCIAGPARRRRLDYGYWYLPPPRDPTGQRDFQRAELHAQALESCLAGVCGLRFGVSLDDPDLCPALCRRFSAAVERCAERLTADGLPPRARALADDLGALRRRL